MGRMRHHAIIVTGADQKAMRRAHKKACKIFKKRVSNLLPSWMNGYVSFLIPPDGSKEDRPESDDFDRRRERFQSWLYEHGYADGSSPFDWIEVEYGGDGPLITPGEAVGDDIPF